MKTLCTFLLVFSSLSIAYYIILYFAAQSNILQPTSIVAEGSVNVGHANGIYGDDAVRRVDPLLSGAQKAWINTDDELCAGTLQEFYCFIHNISLLIDRFRTIYLQIWMPIDIVNLEFELVFSKAANITIDSNVGLLLKVSTMYLQLGQIRVKI